MGTVFHHDFAATPGVPAWLRGMGRPPQGEGTMPFPALGSRILRAGPVQGGLLPGLAPTPDCPEPRATGLQFTSGLFLNRDAMEHPAVKPLLPRLATFAYDWPARAMLIRAQLMSPALQKVLGTSRTYLAGSIHSNPYGVSVHGGWAEALVRISGRRGAFFHWWLHTWGAKTRASGGTAGGVSELDICEAPGDLPDTSTMTLHGDGIMHGGVGERLRVGVDLSEGFNVLRAEWGTTWVRWLVNGRVVREAAKPDLLDDRARFYLTLGLDVGNQDWWATRPAKGSREVFNAWVRRITAGET